MGGYLEAYGADEAQRARRSRIVKRSILGAVLAAIVVLILWAQFRNYRQESVVRHFLGLLSSHSYADAYRMFGCTETTPCPNYAFPKFLEDWGPKSSIPDASKATLGLVQTCGDGVFVQVTYPGAKPTNLIVSNSTNQITFAPEDWAECPGRHWHFRRWWDSLLHKSPAS